jgi:hypothetical protein
MTRHLSLLLGLALCSSLLLAAEKEAKPADGFVPLFNGKDLGGWVVTGCKAAVENGNLVILEGDGLIRTEKQYGDYVLELDWKNRKAEKYDSGIYFRSDLPRAGQRWPDKYQINLQQGAEGSIVGKRDARVKDMAKPGEWNHFKLTCKADKATLEINGKEAWDVEGIDPAVGYIGIQVEVTGGGQFEFKDIKVKAMTPPVEGKK